MGKFGMYRRHFRACAHLVLASTASLWVGCGQARYGDINIKSEIVASDGLDLRAVGELVKTTKDAKDLEASLNRPDGINNLDLNEDGKVDFIHVTEYGNDDSKGFSLSVQPAKGETQEIATIEIQKEPDGQAAQVSVTGDQHIYGHHHHYQYRHSLTGLLVASYLFRPHPYYVSPFYHGYYPRYYGRGYSRVSHVRYVSRTRSVVSRSTSQMGTSSRRSGIVSPNKGKSASRGIRASLKNPTKAQRSFRSQNRARSSGRGFGRRGSSSRKRGFGRSRSSGSRRSRGFGRGRSRGFRSRR